MVVDEADLQTGLEPLCQLVQLLKPILQSAAKQLSMNQSSNSLHVWASAGEATEDHWEIRIWKLCGLPRCTMHVRD